MLAYGHVLLLHAGYVFIYAVALELYNVFLSLHFGSVVATGKGFTFTFSGYFMIYAEAQHLI